MKNSETKDIQSHSINTVLSAVHLAPYLPYNLKLQTKYVWTTLHSLCTDGGLEINDGYEDSYSADEVKPILRPISDLTKKIKINNTEIIVKEILSQNLQMMIDIFDIPSVEDIKVYDYNRLLELHFDVFGLIEKGLAVDINTLSVE